MVTTNMMLENTAYKMQEKESIFASFHQCYTFIYYAFSMTPRQILIIKLMTGDYCLAILFLCCPFYFKSILKQQVQQQHQNRVLWRCSSVFLFKLLCFNSFQSNVSFLHPLKTSQNLCFAGVFRSCKKGTLARNVLRFYFI